ncbi:TIGR00267 family protein [Ferroglobus sp.]|uniref:TIGR00267 family protein n=1 Tax=Ferroglobus sp. TaxID=2614230 RepID=UPI0025BA44B4|nr:TIGR00267 family protein [Ferroglobus sp.]
MERQLVRGFIDGSLSTLGVVIGASGAEISIIIAAGIGGGVANGLSNVFGAFTAERIEEEMQIVKIERAMLKNLKETEIYKSVRRKVLKKSLIDGVSTIFGSVIVVLPFFFALVLNASPFFATLVSIALTTVALGLIGLYLGKLSKENLAISFAKMAAFGIVTAFLSMLVEKGVHFALG